ncbi:MAG: hypothetical protein HY200_05140 [Nitrospirae bacterium]|nr:hypothetical protein [Nitrospirota bacterium]
MTQTRKTLALLFLMALWVAVFIYQYNHQLEEKHLPLKYKKGDVSPPAAVFNSTDSTVRLDLLRASPQPLTITKNIFEPIHIYVPPPPKVEPPPPPPPVYVPPPPTPEEIARAQATKSLSEFKYLGYLDRGKSKEQGFFSRGGELFNVGKGETIVGSFILKDLNPNQAVLRDKATGVESTLILSQ